MEGVQGPDGLPFAHICPFGVRGWRGSWTGRHARTHARTAHVQSTRDPYHLHKRLRAGICSST
eukprot:2305343-Amphidinium_carterae.2